METFISRALPAIQCRREQEVTLTIPLDKASTHSPPKAGLGYKITPAAKSDSLGYFVRQIATSSF